MVEVDAAPVPTAAVIGLIGIGKIAVAGGMTKFLFVENLSVYVIPAVVEGMYTGI